MRDKLVADSFRNSVEDEDVLKRAGVLFNAFVRLKKILVGDEKDLNCDINRAILTNSLYSYFYDIKRAKDFHGIKLINKPKKSAYLLKWLTKDKPIWFRSEAYSDSNTLELLSCVNEIYALRVALGYAKIPLALIDEELEERLVYELIYRNVDEGIMSLWFETFMTFHGIDKK